MGRKPSGPLMTPKAGSQFQIVTCPRCVTMRMDSSCCCCRKKRRISLAKSLREMTNVWDREGCDCDVCRATRNTYTLDARVPRPPRKKKETEP